MSPRAHRIEDAQRAVDLDGLRRATMSSRR
jgi:hypothetical protein